MDQHQIPHSKKHIFLAYQVNHKFLADRSGGTAFSRQDPTRLLHAQQMEMEEDGLQKYQFGEEDEKMEGQGLMVRYSGDGVPKTAMGDKNEPGSSYNLSSGWYLSQLQYKVIGTERKSFYDNVREELLKF